MYSNNAETSGLASAGKTWRWSITHRMVMSYTLSAVVMFAIMYAFLNWTITDTLVQAENEYINDRIRVFRAIIETRPDFVDVIRQNIEWEGAYVKHPEYYARILDMHCRTMVETPRMGELIPSQRFPAPCDVEQEVKNQLRPGKNIAQLNVNGRSYLLASYWTDAVKSSERRAIQIALDVTAEKASIQTNQRRMIAVIMAGILFALLFGFVVARKVLQPLNELAGLAKRITIDKMGMRVKDPLRWPVELRTPALAFHEMLERLKDSFVQISEYTANLAHELRTPINNLMGEAEVALSQERTAEEYRKVLESGLEEHMRIARMIDALLFLARSEHPANKVESSLFDPIDEISRVCSFYEALADEKQAQVTWSGEGKLYGDPTLFRRVMSNLVSNAIYYASPGVKIDISVTKNADSSLDVVVSDTGFGIPAEDLNNVFDRFYRVMSSRSSNPKGSGLGLSVVKFIMELHNGTVTIKSAPAQGTTVILHFPVPPKMPYKITPSNSSL